MLVAMLKTKTQFKKAVIFVQIKIIKRHLN